MIGNRRLDHGNWTVYNCDKPINHCLGTVEYCKGTVDNCDITENPYKGNVHHGYGY